jgi:hypothetical protein
MLISEYEKRSGRPIWNFSGFGSNDPGRNRESQASAKFDLDYPVDIDRKIEFIEPGEYELLRAILQLKASLPYLFRYDTQGRHYSRGHPEMESKKIVIPEEPTIRTILQMILSSLPPDWQATVLPNRVILYKEKHDYAEQVDVLRRSS